MRENYIRDNWLLIAAAILFAIGVVLALSRPVAAEHGGPIPPVEDQFCIPSYYLHFGSGYSFYTGWFGYEDDLDFFCYFDNWAGNASLHATRAEITEEGGLGFGFTMNQDSGLPLGQGATNTTLNMYWFADSFTMSGDVNGSEFTVDFLGFCGPFFGRPPCEYYAETLTLGDGWMAANGIDFSNSTYQIDLDFPPEFDGAGLRFPYYPFNVDLFDDPAKPTLWDLSNNKPITLQLEDFFGIKFSIHFEDRTDLVPVPEPGFGIALAIGSMGLFALCRKRV